MDNAIVADALSPLVSTFDRAALEALVRTGGHSADWGQRDWGQSGHSTRRGRFPPASYEGLSVGKS